MALLAFQAPEPVFELMRALVASAGALLPAGLAAHQPLARTAIAGALGAALATGLFSHFLL